MCFAERRQKQPARDAAGAALGCFGLAGFALVCWLCLPRIDTAAVFALAIFVWLALAATAWLLRKKQALSPRARPTNEVPCFSQFLTCQASAADNEKSRAHQPEDPC